GEVYSDAHGAARRSSLRINCAPMSASSPLTSTRPDWPRRGGESLKQNGPWHTFTKLLEARGVYPDDLALRGYVEILRNAIVREFLAHPRGVHAVPKLSPDFLTNFE